MSSRVGILLLAAILTGGLAAYLAYGVLQGSTTEDSRATTVEVVDVIVAARDMSAGRMLAPDDVKLVEWPASSIPVGFSRSAAEVAGHGLLTDVKTNEPILASRVASREAGGGLPVVIPPGMRAMAVKVDNVVGVAGFVLPGTRVDVLVTLDQQAGEDVARTRVMLQNVTVVSAGQVTERDEQGEPREVPVVTLLVTPEDGEKLALATGKGTIRLALRNSLDLETVSTPGIAVNRLIVDPAPPVRRAPVRTTTQRPAPPPEPPPQTRFEIEVYRGPARSTETVEKREGEEEEEEGEGGGEDQ